MTRRQQLTEAQIAALFDPPTEQRELVRHYTLSAADLAMIRRCRGDHNRLGQALMLCYLRYPGRPLKSDERPPEALLSFVAEQIDVLPASFDTYVVAERNRQRHSAEMQDRLGLYPQESPHFRRPGIGAIRFASVGASTVYALEREHDTGAEKSGRTGCASRAAAILYGSVLHAKLTP